MWVSDRYWWIWLAAGLGAGAGCIIWSVNFLSTNLILDRELGDPITTDLLLAAAFAIMGIVLALVMSVMSIRGRYRHRQRTEALRGNLDAVPLAAIPVSPIEAPDLMAGSLVLQWRATRQMRFGEGPLYAVLFLLQLAYIFIAPALLIVAFVTAPDKGRLFTFRQPGDILAVGGAAALGIIGPAIAIYILRYAPTLFGRPYGVVATLEGIECATEYGRKYLVPWDEARLFEVSGSGRSTLGSRQYRLYGRRRVASWSTDPTSMNEFAPDGITPGEMAQRLQAMVNLVVARTGLQPRTFSKALRAIPNPAHTNGEPVPLATTRDSHPLTMTADE